jgi:acyl-coenzyme A thioesterase PaaI-like protein
VDAMTDKQAMLLPPIGPEAEKDEAWIDWANGFYLCRAVGLRCTALDEGSGIFSVTDPPGPRNPNGAVNGGVITSIADTVLGVMAKRAAPAEVWPVTAALHSQFVGPSFAPLTLRARALGGGRRVRYIDVTVENADGEICATTHGTMVLGPGAPG